MLRVTLALIAAALGGALSAAEPRQPVAVRTLAFSADGKFVAAGFGDKDKPGGLVIWDVVERKTARVLRGDRGVSSVAFAPAGSLLAFTEFDRPPSVIDLATGAIVTTLAEPCRGPVAFSPDGGRLACCASDKTIHFWDIKSQTEQRVLSGAMDRVYGRIVFSSDGSLLLTPCGSAGVYVWDLATGAPRHVLKHGQFFSRSALFSEGERWIVTGGWDGTTRIWDAVTGNQRARLAGMAGVNSLDLASTGALLAVAGGDEIKIFALALAEPTAESHARMKALMERWNDDRMTERDSASQDLIQLGFVAEAELQRAAADSPSAETRLRARRARQAILSQTQATLLGHKGDVWSAVFSPDGKWLASCGDDGTVRLWDLAGRTELARFVPAELDPPHR